MMFYDKIGCPSLKFYANFLCKPKHLFVVSFRNLKQFQNVKRVQGPRFSGDYVVTSVCFVDM